MSYPPDVTVLTLTPDNPCNTIITRADGSEVYRVNTETGEVPRTFVPLCGMLKASYLLRLNGTGYGTIVSLGRITHLYRSLTG